MRITGHPILALGRVKRMMVFLGALVLTFVVYSALSNLDRQLVTPAAPWGMLSFEFARTPERSSDILGSWSETARATAGSSLLLDFLFPVCYSTALTIAAFWAAGLFHERGFQKMGRVATLTAWAQWPAAAMDYVENIALWMQLRGSVEDPWPRTAYVFASIKFLLIGAGLVVIAAAFVVWLLRRRAAATLPLHPA